MAECSQVIGEHDVTMAYTTTPSYQVNSARLDYVYSGSQRIYSRVRTSSGGSWTTKYYLSDRLSTRLGLDSSGNVVGRQGHFAFGDDLGESGTQDKHHFTSYERDGESGLDYAVNRHFSHSTGRFTRVDPRNGNLFRPQRLNLYSYVLNNPINGIDRKGLDGEDDEPDPVPSPEPPTFDHPPYDYTVHIIDPGLSSIGGRVISVWPAMAVVPRCSPDLAVWPEWWQTIFSPRSIHLDSQLFR